MGLRWPDNEIVLILYEYTSPASVPGNMVCFVLTLVGLGCHNYVKAWGGGGGSALPLKNSKKR